jgi:hypothetical protein
MEDNHMKLPINSLSPLMNAAGQQQFPTVLLILIALKRVYCLLGNVTNMDYLMYSLQIF